MNVKERLKLFIKSQNLTVAKFERSIFVSNGYINNISKSIGIDNLNKILETYSTLNVEWLIKGNGKMLKTTPFLTQNEVNNTVNEPENDYKNEFFLEKENFFLKEKIKMLEQERDFLKQIIKPTTEEKSNCA